MPKKAVEIGRGAGCPRPVPGAPLPGRWQIATERGCLVTGSGRVREPSLLADPVVAIPLAPHPGRGPRVGPGVVDVAVAVRGPPVGAAEELEQPVVLAVRAD